MNDKRIVSMIDLALQKHDTPVADNNAEQIAMLNQKLADFAPLMPHSHENSTGGLLKSVS